MAAKPYHLPMWAALGVPAPGAAFFIALFSARQALCLWSEYKLVSNSRNAVFRLCLSEPVVKKLVD